MPEHPFISYTSLLFRRGLLLTAAFLLLTACGGAGTEDTPSDKTNPPPSSDDGSVKSLYIQQCASCHGQNGEGSFAGGELYNCSTCNNWEALQKRILDTMPLGNPALCGQDCSHALATLIYNDFNEDANPDLDADAPVADYSRSANLMGIAPLSVLFDATASRDNGEIVEYRWDFGNGDSATGSEVVRVFPNPGSYSVTLTVTDDVGKQSSATLIVTVLDPQINPAEGIYLSQCASCHGADGSGTSGNPALTTGRSLSEQTEIVRSMPPGVGIYCGNIDNCAELVAQYILDRFARQNTPPIADASASSGLQGSAPIRINLDASRSDDDHGIRSYHWDLGDGNTRSGASASYIYTAPGNYTVTLTVTDDEGLSSTDTLAVVVSTANSNSNQAPLAAIRARANNQDYFAAFSGPAPLRAQFYSDLSADDKGITNVTWNFSDGATIPGSSVTRTYQTPGQYGVTLTVRDAEGLEDSVSLQITVTQDTSSGPGQYFACSVDSTPTDSVRRLSIAQYRNTLEDLLRTRMNNTNASSVWNGLAPLLADFSGDQDNSGYHNMDQRVTLLLVENQLIVADTFADLVTNSNVRLREFVGDSCATTWSNNECKTNFIKNFGEQALRRAINDNDVADLLQGVGSYRELIARILMSPDFLYHTEFDGTPIGNSTDRLSLSPYELAARLSYLYWNTMPDAQLLADARSGNILTNYNQVAQRVFDDPRTRAHLVEFFDQWLRLSDTIPSDLSLGHPGFTTLLQHDYGTGTTLPSSLNSDEYRKDAIAEVLRLAEYVIWESGGGVEELFTNNNSFATSANLAKAYGVSPWSGNWNSLVNFPAGQRSGLLTRAALQMYGGVDTHPILEGVRIRRNILCDTLGSPPADNSPPAQAVIEPHFSTRDRVKAITEIPGTDCQGCHERAINPAGFATENYDALGRYRTHELLFDGLNQALLSEQPSVHVGVHPFIELNDTSTYISNSTEFSEEIAKSGKTKACLARNYYRYSFSRQENTDTDGCTLSGLFTALEENGLEGMLRAIALQAQFKERKHSGN